MIQDDMHMEPLKPEVASAIADLVAKAPNEPAMKLLKAELRKAASAAAGGNERIMTQAFKSAFGHSNTLGTKGHDLLVEVESVMEKIRSSLP